MMRVSTFVWLCLSAGAPVLADEAWTANTRKLAPSEASAAANIAELAWLAGAWRGAGLGGVNEEHWSVPAGGTMMGMYRLLKDERVVFYELLTLGESGGSLLITLRHFHPDLRGWEERDETVRMPFIKAEAGRYYFEGLTLEPRPDGTLTVYLAIASKDKKDGAAREVTFSYQRG
jgi:hypothetical protein